MLKPKKNIQKILKHYKRIGLHICIKHFKCKLYKNEEENRKKKTIHKIKEYFHLN